MFAAIILFIVSVPVLSEQMQVVEPRVSTTWSFLVRIFSFQRRFAVRLSAIVTYGFLKLRLNGETKNVAD